ncbi:MAG: hypothetical protein QM764_19350 [Chitinophagaceae bacterium]
MKTYTNAVQDVTPVLKRSNKQQDRLQPNENNAMQNDDSIEEQKYVTNEAVTNYFKVIQAQADEDRPE